MNVQMIDEIMYLHKMYMIKIEYGNIHPYFFTIFHFHNHQKC